MSRLLNSSRVFRLSALAGAMVLAHSAVAEEAQELNALIISASGTEHTQMTAPAFTTVIDEKMLSNVSVWAA